MNNKRFNLLIKIAFETYHQDSKLLDAIYSLWLNGRLTNDQDKKLEEIREDILRGLASCAERYYL